MSAPTPPDPLSTTAATTTRLFSNPLPPKRDPSRPLPQPLLHSHHSKSAQRLNHHLHQPPYGNQTNPRLHPHQQKPNRPQTHQDQGILYPLASSGRGFLPRPIPHHNDNHNHHHHHTPADQPVAIPKSSARSNPMLDKYFQHRPPYPYQVRPYGFPHSDPSNQAVHLVRPPTTHLQQSLLGSTSGAVPNVVRGVPLSTNPKMLGVGGCGGGDRDRHLRKRQVVDDDLDANSDRLKGRRIPASARPRATITQARFAKQSQVGMYHKQTPASFVLPTVRASGQLGPLPMHDDIFRSGASSINQMAGSSRRNGRRNDFMTVGFQPFQKSYERGEDEDEDERGEDEDEEEGKEEREEEEEVDDDVDRGRGYQGGPPRSGRVGLASGQGQGEGGDPYWRLTDSLPGGPTIPDPLCGFLGHIAHAIWNKEEREVLTCHSGADCLASWVILSPETTNLVASSTLAHLRDCMFQHLNMPLISAFVERWHPETNSFHMPFGEMTITLHDVWYILRIPVTGNPLMSQTDVLGIKGHLAALLGMSMCEVNSELKSNNVRFRTVQDRLSPPGVRGATETATGYLFLLLGATLFLDKSSTSLSVQYLPFLLTLDDVPGYAWGAATLACLYRQLGIASRADTREIAGCLTLLQAWIYEYFPAFRPSRRERWTPDLPCSLKWAPTSTPRTPTPGASQATLLKYRRTLDRISVDLVKWTPFGKNLKRDVPITLFSGIIHCGSITEPYMPDRCLRQFGYVQAIPTQVYIPRKVYRGRKPFMYICEHDVMLRTWQEWRHCLMNPSSIGSSKASFPNEDVDDYLAWFRQRSHPRVSPPKGDSDDDDGDIPPQQMSDAARLQYLAARIRFLHPSRRQEMDEEAFWEMLDDVCKYMEDLL